MPEITMPANILPAEAKPPEAKPAEMKLSPEEFLTLFKQVRAKLPFKYWGGEVKSINLSHTPVDELTVLFKTYPLEQVAFHSCLHVQKHSFKDVKIKTRHRLFYKRVINHEVDEVESNVFFDIEFPTKPAKRFVGSFILRGPEPETLAFEIKANKRPVEQNRISATTELNCTIL